VLVTFIPHAADVYMSLLLLSSSLLLMVRLTVVDDRCYGDGVVATSLRCQAISTSSSMSRGLILKLLSAASSNKLFSGH